MQKIITFLLLITAGQILYAQGFGNEDCEENAYNGVTVYTPRSTTNVYSDACITIITNCTTYGGPCDQENYHTDCSTTVFSNGGSGCNGTGGNNDAPYITTSTYELNCESCTIYTTHHTNGQPDDVGSPNCTPIPGCTQSTFDCYGDVNGSAFWSTECNACLGGNTGYADCEAKDPCGTFIKWVRENKNVDTTTAYFNRNKNIKVQNGVCTQNTNPSCDIAPQFWNEKSLTEKYYYENNAWILYNNCGITCLPVKIDKTRTIGTVTATTGKTQWCTFYCLSALKGGDACTYATWYYENIYSTGGGAGIGCSLDIGTYGYHIPALFSNFGYTATFVSISNACDLISQFQGGKKAVLDESPGHNSLIYGVHRNKSGVVTIDKFDTSNNLQWDNPGIAFTNYNIGGTDYAIQ